MVAGLSEGSKSACNRFPFAIPLENHRLEGSAEKTLSERLVMFDPYGTWVQTPSTQWLVLLVILGFGVMVDHHN